MKKIDAFMKTVDQRVDQLVGTRFRYIGKYFTIFSATLLTLFLLLYLFKAYYTKPYFVASLIKADLTQIESILHKVDSSCEILGTQSNAEKINFLTIKEFAGSMVGGINLAHPDNWQGPYLEQNPSIQRKFYQLVKARDGIFIIPGQGVVLPNSFTVGKDVVITPHTLVEPMLKPGGSLHFRGIELGRKISFKVGDWTHQPPKQESIDKINKSLEQFNEAMSFTENPKDLVLT